jgi:hypothetical protein
MTEAKVRDVRQELLALHKQLLEAERERHERVHGRIAPADFLRLLIEDATFAWLGPLTALIVRADEWLEDVDRVVTDGSAWLAEVRVLLAPDPAGPEFQHKYAALLQDRPGVVLAHGAVMRALRGQAN